MTVLFESFLTVVPVFLVILLGYFLRRRFDQTFIKKTSILQFYVAMPALVLSSLLNVELADVFDLPIILAAVLATIAVLLIALIASFCIKDLPKRGPFIQGSYRANIGIIGFALVQNVAGIEFGAIVIALIAVIMPLYNVVSAIVLSLFVRDANRRIVAAIATKIVRNPIILAVASSLLIQALRLQTPGFLLTSLGYLRNLALPLSLLSIGMSLRFRSIAKNWKPLSAAMLFKLVLCPLLALGFARLFGVDSSFMLPLFLACGAPTAVASFAMTQAMDNDGEMAAQIIAASTVASLVTLTLGVSILQAQ